MIEKYFGIKRNELEAPIVSKYVSDVYLFLFLFVFTFTLSFNIQLINSQSIILMFLFVISSMLLIFGIFSLVVNPLCAMQIGLLASKYVPYTTNIIVFGYSLSIILFINTLITKYLLSIRLIKYFNIIISIIESLILAILVKMNYITIGLFIVAKITNWCFYLNIDNTFDRAKMHLYEENRNKYIVLDAISLFFIKY